MVRSRTEVVFFSLAISLAFLWASLFIFIPVGSLFLQFQDLSHFFSSLFSTTTLGPLRISLIQSSLSTLLSLALGSALAFGLFRSHSSFRLSSWFLSIPYTTPTIVVATTWISLLGNQGLLSALNLAYSLTAVIIAHTALNIPLVALLVLQSLRLCPKEEIDAARTLSPSWIRTLLSYWFVRLRPTFVMAGAQVFSLCMTSFAIVLLLGGGPPIETLETGVYARIRYGSPQWAEASALAFWQILFCSLPAIVLGLKQLPRRIEAPRETFSTQFPHIISLSVAGFLGFLYFIPFLASRWTPEYFSFLNSGEFWSEMLPALWDSIRLSLVAASFGILLSLIIGLCMINSRRWRSLFSFLAQIPSGLSILIVCLGVWFSFSQWVDPFQSSFWITAFIQGTFFIPFLVRSFASWFTEVTWEGFEVARSLGANVFVSLREVLWPPMKRPILLLGLICFGANLSEFAAVSFFQSGDLITLPVLLSRWLSQYRFAEAEILALLLLCLGLAATNIQMKLKESHESRD